MRLAAAAAILLILGGCQPGPQPTSRAPSPTAGRPVASPSPSHVPFDTTRVTFTSTDIPDLGSRVLEPGELALNQATRLLYLTDPGANQIRVFDVARPVARYVTAVALPSAPRDLVVAPDLRKLFVTLASGAVGVVELDPALPSAHTVSGTIDLGAPGPALAMEYAVAERRLFIAVPAVGAVAVVDANTLKLRFKVSLGNVDGRFRYHPGRGIFFATPTALWRLDPKLDPPSLGIGEVAVATRFDLPGCSAIGIDAVRDQALLSCKVADAYQIQRWDFATSRVVAIYEQIGNADNIVYSAAEDRFFIAAPGFFRGPALGMFGGPRGLFVTNVPTSPVSRGVAFDETNRLVYTQGERGIRSFPSPPARP